MQLGNVNRQEYRKERKEGNKGVDTMQTMIYLERNEGWRCDSNNRVPA
jgi:hypothetical protein